MCNEKLIKETKTMNNKITLKKTKLTLHLYNKNNLSFYSKNTIWGII